MKLVDNWPAVIRKAWSFRLMVIAGVLSGAEVALTLMDTSFIPPGIFAAISGGLTFAALIARLVAQNSLKGSSDDKPSS